MNKILTKLLLCDNKKINFLNLVPVKQAGVYPGRIIPRVKSAHRPGYNYYDLGQFIPPQAKLYTHDINHDINSVERYTQELFNFSTSEDSVFSGKLSERAIM